MTDPPVLENVTTDFPAESQDPHIGLFSHPELPTGTDVKRALKTHHLSMIALGGSIGTGLLLACGETLRKSGPGGSLVCYVMAGTMVYFLMSGLGELATGLPISGSFSTFSEKFVDPALGFAVGWNEFFKHSITYVVDCLTAGILMQFWLPNVPTWIWNLLAFVIIFLINAITVKSFGVIEFWMALIKVITILVFIVVGVLRIFGAVGHPTYFENFVYKDAPFFGGFYGFIATFIVAGFSFQGTELVGITAAESENPDVSIPAAIRQVFWRILIFYVCSIFVVACLIPYDNPNLLGSDSGDVTKSPFTMVLEQAHIPVAKDAMNGVILSAIISAANSATYSSARMLYSLALNGKAPALFKRTLPTGIPIFALCGTSTVCILLYIMNHVARGVYSTLIKASSLAGFVNWFTIGVSHYRFRRGFLAQGLPAERMHYHAKFFPVGPIVVVAVCVIIIICSNLNAAREGQWSTVAISYMSVVMFVVLYIVYKIVKKTRIVPYETMFDGLEIHRKEDEEVMSGRLSPTSLLAAAGPV
jgi:lysine-specific permease